MDDTMIDVSIIIVSYNTKEMTLECLRSLYDQTSDISFEVIVFDNDSNDCSADAIEQEFPDVILIKSKKNVGFAKANNLAIIGRKSKYILLLNPDTVILDRAIAKLYAFAVKNPSNQIYGGRTFSGDYSLDPTSCWRRPTIWSLFCYAFCLTSLFHQNKFFDPETYGNWQRDSVRQVDIVTGCFLLIETNLWQKLKGFSPDFFMYAEEADLCLRAKNKFGANPLFSPSATIIHYGGASFQVSDDKMVRMLKAKNQLLNNQWSKRKAYTGSQLYLIGVLFRTIVFRVFAIGARRFRKKSQSWQSVWKRRREWAKG